MNNKVTQLHATMLRQTDRKTNIIHDSIFPGEKYANITKSPFPSP